MPGFDAIQTGGQANVEKTVTEDDVRVFARISGDTNPVHLDEEYAKGTIFRGRVAHGMLTAALISTVLGTKLPGPGTIYLHQTLKFLAPVRLGDTVLAEVEVLGKDSEKRRLRLATRCRVQDKVVLEGEALVQVPP